MAESRLSSLGKYEIRATLGRGAMGTVYEGWDPSIARRVAIKTVQLPDAADAEAQEELQRFRREAQAAGRLNHPNIVGVFDYGETAELAYIVMEFVDGRSWKSVLDAQERLALPEVVRVMGELLAGLQYSHERGVVHRDIKPANLILTQQGQTKIADFGIARIESSSMTQAGTVMGTPAYMSPEQFMGQTVDARTDIYSSGVVLYQLLTGERPFEGSMTAIMHKALNTQPPKPSDLSVTVPTAFDAVVARAMGRRPEDRYASAAAFAEAIRGALAAPVAPTGIGMGALDFGPDADATMVTAAPRPVVAPPVAALPPTAVAPARGGGRMKLVVAGVAVLLVGGAGAWFALGGKPAPVTPAEQHAAASIPAAPVVPGQTVAGTLAGRSAPTGAVVPPAPEAAGPAAAPAPAAQVPARQEQVLAPPTAPIQSPPPPSQASVPPPAIAAAPSVPPPPAVAVPPTTAAAPGTAPPPPQPLVLATANVPRAMLRDITAALGTVGCTLTGAEATGSGGLVVTGLSGAGGPQDALARALAQADPAASVTWRLATFDAPYCGALDLLRPLPPGLKMVEADERTPLLDDELILLRLTLPDFPAYLHLDYFASDGSVYHMLHATPDGSRRYAPGAHELLGEPKKGFPGWRVGPPYGRDMIAAIATSAPLFSQVGGPDSEPVGEYLPELQAALDSARKRGVSLSGSAFLLVTAPKP